MFNIKVLEIRDGALILSVDPMKTMTCIELVAAERMFSSLAAIATHALAAKEAREAGNDAEVKEQELMCDHLYQQIWPELRR